MNRLKKVCIWTFIAFLSLGFRVFPGKWNISKTDPTIWVRICSSPVTIEENDITGNDPLTGIAGLTIQQVMQSVIDDYNAVPTSYLRMALYPADPNNPGAPAAGDSTFTIAAAETRTIDICFDGTDASAGLSGGHASAKTQGDTIIGCEIKVRKDRTAKAYTLTHLIAHEIGHCFGLMHPQESVNSVMSYFTTSDDFLRLQNDDKAGLTFRYPEEEAYAQEQSTLGLTGCSPK